MACLAAGDENALAELIARWQKPVLAHVVRFLGCTTDEARDIAQEAFLRVWLERRRWQPQAAFSTWLFTVVLNLCRNQRRSQLRRPVLVPIAVDDHGEPLSDVPADVADDPFARTQANELAAIMEQALRALTDNQRAAVLLRRFEGMSYREIGAVLDVSESAVESLLVRARRALAEAILGSDRKSAQEKEDAGVEL